MPDQPPELIVADAGAWQQWLSVHHDDPTGVWLVLAKKGTVDPTNLSYHQALEVALCYGWIDGQVRRRDQATFQQRFTQRRPRGAWSQRNVGIATRLIEQGRMQSAGLVHVERARADGRWEAAYAGPATIKVPPELSAALANEPLALAMFNRLSAQNRYAILYRLQTAKQVQTRARRMAKYVQMLARGQTIYPQSGSAPDSAGSADPAGG